MRKSTALCAPIAVTLALTAACGGGADDDVVEQSTVAVDAPSNTDEAPAPSASPTPTEDGTKSTLLATGFGQDGEYAWVTGLARNDSTHVGQTVTLQFNLMDAAGTILVSDSHVEGFSRPGQLLALGTQVTVPGGAQAASVEATLLVEDDSVFGTEPFPEITVSTPTIVENVYGGYDVNAEITNPTSEPLQSPRVGAICYDAGDKVIGGGATYPNLIPPSGVALASFSVIVSSPPARCDVHVAPGL